MSNKEQKDALTDILAEGQGPEGNAEIGKNLDAAIKKEKEGNAAIEVLQKQMADMQKQIDSYKKQEPAEYVPDPKESETIMIHPANGAQVGVKNSLVAIFEKQGFKKLK